MTKEDLWILFVFGWFAAAFVIVGFMVYLERTGQI